MGLLRRAFVRCPNCKGGGRIFDKRRVPRNQLSSTQVALELSEGGYHYQYVNPRVCGRCNGTGRR